MGTNFVSRSLLVLLYSLNLIRASLIDWSSLRTLISHKDLEGTYGFPKQLYLFYFESVLVSYFSIAVVRHHEPRQRVKKEEFIWGFRFPRHGGHGRKHGVRQPGGAPSNGGELTT